MTSSLLVPIAAFMLAAASVGGVLFALFQPRFAGGSPLDRRVEAIAGPRVATVRWQTLRSWVLSRKRMSVCCTLPWISMKIGLLPLTMMSEMSSLASNGCSGP